VALIDGAVDMRSAPRCPAFASARRDGQLSFRAAGVQTGAMADEGWSNFSGRVAFTPERIARPKSEAELRALVREAASAGRTVRVAGTGHSFTPLVQTEGLLLSLDDLSGIESVDPVKREAVIRAGTKLHALGEPLLAHGLAMQNMGDVDVQALAGAVSTGTHGTGPGLANVSSQVVGARLVLASGEPLELSAEADGERLDAARVSLGLLGVFSTLTLRLVPAYRLHERVWRADTEVCLSELDANVAHHRHFEFWWYPHRDFAEQKALQPTEAEPVSVAGRKGERIDWSARILPSVRELRFNEMEYSVPAEAGPACFRAVRDRMRSRWPEVVWPVEYRTLAADSAWLSTAHRRPTVAISLHQDAKLDPDAFFADCEAIFRAHEGRPHWGKLHTRTRAELARLYPDWERFRALRAQLDPGGTFANAYLRGLFGIA
jgi:FAD/FMN-containing dehydrogenase